MSTPHYKLAGKFQRYFLVSMLLLLLISLILFARPFLIDLLMSSILVVAAYPIHKKIRKFLQFSPTLAALISMLIVTIVVVLPFTLFAVFMAYEAGDAYSLISRKINEMVVSEQVTTPAQFLSVIPFADQAEELLKYLPFTTEDLLKTISESVGQFSTFLLGQTTNILRHLSLFIIHILVFLMAIFYFFRDGDRLVNYLRSLVPLGKTYREELFGKLAHLSYGIIYGLFGAAILQGLLVGFGFAVAGFHNAAFWGLIAALFSPIPYLGTMIVWLPAVVILAVGSHWWAALLLLIWCMGVVSTADNFIKPYLIGASSALNPMALLIVLLGGTFAFGLKGLILGPFILTLSLSFLHIYQLEYESVLDGKEVLVKEPVVKKGLRLKEGRKRAL